MYYLSALIGKIVNQDYLLKVFYKACLIFEQLD
jgi:hypothetical protein